MNASDLQEFSVLVSGSLTRSYCGVADKLHFTAQEFRATSRAQKTTASN